MTTKSGYISTASSSNSSREAGGMMQPEARGLSRTSESEALDALRAVLLMRYLLATRGFMHTVQHRRTAGSFLPARCTPQWLDQLEATVDTFERALVRQVVDLYFPNRRGPLHHGGEDAAVVQLSEARRRRAARNRKGPAGRPASGG